MWLRSVLFYNALGECHKENLWQLLDWHFRSVKRKGRKMLLPLKASSCFSGSCWRAVLSCRKSINGPVRINVVFYLPCYEGDFDFHRSRFVESQNLDTMYLHKTGPLTSAEIVHLTKYIKPWESSLLYNLKHTKQTQTKVKLVINKSLIAINNILSRHVS